MHPLRLGGVKSIPCSSDMMQSRFGQWKEFARRGLKTFGEMFYGATIYDMVRDLSRERAQREYLFVLITFGDLLGMPILSPYYTLRLLPYVLPHIEGWRTGMLRERDLTDLCDQEIT